MLQLPDVAQLVGDEVIRDVTRLTRMTPWKA